MKKMKKYNLMALAFALVLLTNVLISFAETSKRVDLQLVKTNESFDIDGRNFKAWIISSELNFENDALLKRTEELNELDSIKLDESFGAAISLGFTDSDGKLSFSVKKDGIYYVREAENNKSGKIASFIFSTSSVDENNSVRVFPKFIKTQTTLGSKNFVKISSGDRNIRLEGASFKITKLIDDRHKTVIQNGKNYVVSSDKNGEFSVKNLPFGEYYLWEIKAPIGYVKLSKPVKFEITKDESTGSVIFIENKEIPEITIPKTGDALIYLLITGGAVLTVFGYVLVKDKKYDERN